MFINNVRTQVPDAVPSWCGGVSILPVLCEDQKTVGSVFATGENYEHKVQVSRKGIFFVCVTFSFNESNILFILNIFPKY